MQQQFAFAGTVLARLAEIETQKAELFAEEWEQFCHPTEPILLDCESDPDLFVQGQQTRWDDETFERDDRQAHYYPESRKPAKRCGSAIKEATIEQMLEALPTIKQIQELAHSEDIESWIERVQAVLAERMPLAALADRSGLSVVQVWIALLFGGFKIEREGDFYEGEIHIWTQT